MTVGLNTDLPCSQTGIVNRGVYSGIIGLHKFNTNIENVLNDHNFNYGVGDTSSDSHVLIIDDGTNNRIIKLDFFGRIVWIKTAESTVNYLVIDSSDNIIYYSDGKIIKRDSDFNLLFQVAAPALTSPPQVNLKTDSSDNVYFLNTTDTFNNALITKYNSSLVSDWAVSPYLGSSFTSGKASSIVVNSTYSFVAITGASSGIIRRDSSGSFEDETTGYFFQNTVLDGNDIYTSKYDGGSPGLFGGLSKLDGTNFSEYWTSTAAKGYADGVLTSSGELISIGITSISDYTDFDFGPIIQKVQSDGSNFSVHYNKLNQITSSFFYTDLLIDPQDRFYVIFNQTKTALYS